MSRGTDGINAEHSPDTTPQVTAREPETDPAEQAADGESDVTVEQLYAELGMDGGADTQSVRLTPEQHSEVILENVLSGLFEGSEFVFEESTVKDNLDEILLLLVAHRASEAHGKSLMGDLATVFDTRLSPGTVYPQLHELEDEGLLRVQELVRTKEYRIDDEAELADRVAAAMEQHLALGLYFKAALAELN